MCPAPQRKLPEWGRESCTRVEALQNNVACNRANSRAHAAMHELHQASTGTHAAHKAQEQEKEIEIEMTSNKRRDTN